MIAALENDVVIIDFENGDSHEHTGFHALPSRLARVRERSLVPRGSSRVSLPLAATLRAGELIEQSATIERSAGSCSPVPVR